MEHPPEDPVGKRTVDEWKRLVSQLIWRHSYVERKLPTFRAEVQLSSESSTSLDWTTILSRPGV